MAAPGLENGLRILEYVRERGQVGFTELGRNLELNKASLSRFLKVLVERKYLVKVGGQYVPGDSRDLISTRPWDTLISPLLTRISIELKCSALWVEFRHGRMYFIDRIICENGVNMQIPGNSGTQYLINPAGYILLASEPVEVRKKLMTLADYNDNQRDQLPDEKKVLEMINRVEIDDFFDDQGLIFPGSRRGAVPLKGDGGIIGAFVLGMIDQLVNDQKVKENLATTFKLLSEMDL